jgi:photosystem II stability/assembly factor-like uncharacterized protein
MTYAGPVAFWDAQHGLTGVTIDHPDGSTSGEILATMDGGRQWDIAGIARNGIVEVTVAGTADAWALTGCPANLGCAARLYRTTDAGQTWTAAVTDLTWVSFVDPLHGWGVAGASPSTDPGLPAFRRTTDGGRTWTTLPTPCAGSSVGPLRTVAFRSLSSGLAVCALTAGAGGELHAVLATSDGGAHWTTRASTGGESNRKPIGALPYGGYITGIVQASDGTAWIAGDRMAPLASRDGGVTWVPLALGDGAANLVFAAWPMDGSRGYAIMWAADLQATLFEVTDDGGRTWDVRSKWGVAAANGAGEGPANPPAANPPIYIGGPTQPVWAGDPVMVTATTDVTGGGSGVRLASVTVDFGDGTTSTRAIACSAGIELVHVYRRGGLVAPTVTAATSCDAGVSVDLSGATWAVHVFPAAPAASARWPVCSTFQLHLDGGWTEMGLGNVSTRITIRNVGSHGCRLEGYPDVVLLAADGTPMTTHASPATGGAYMFPAVVPHRVALAPGDTGSFMLGYGDNPFGAAANQPYDVACPASAAVRVTLPGTHQFGTAKVSMRVCNGSVAVSPVVPGGAGIRF